MSLDWKSLIPKEALEAIALTLIGGLVEPLHEILKDIGTGIRRVNARVLDETGRDLQLNALVTEEVRAVFAKWESDPDNTGFVRAAIAILKPAFGL